ncbi:MAG: DUF4435 domain-containing protein [Spirochaetota bacterium]
MREFLDQTDYYGQIKFWLNARNSKKENSVAVVVESATDASLFRKFFSHNTFLVPADGNENVKTVMSQISKENIEEVIGIIDADFQRIENQLDDLPANTFLTDGHDLEMMMVVSPAWDNVVEVLVNPEKLTSFEKQTSDDIKSHLLKLASSIASVRLYNHRQDLGLIFKTFHKKNGEYKFIEYSKFITGNLLELNWDKMLQTIENKSNKPNFLTTNDDHKEEINKIAQENHDWLEFCNGHDFLNILAIALSKAIGNKKVSGKDLSESFIIAYRMDDFKQTQLYASLVIWNQSHKFTLWKQESNLAS